MRFLLGDRARLQPVWKAYGIQPQGEGFEHSAYVLLIDKRGRQRIGFPVDQLTTANWSTTSASSRPSAPRRAASTSPRRGVAPALAALLDPERDDHDDHGREVEQRVVPVAGVGERQPVIAPRPRGATGRGW